MPHSLSDSESESHSLPKPEWQLERQVEVHSGWQAATVIASALAVPLAVALGPTRTASECSGTQAAALAVTA